MKSRACLIPSRWVVILSSCVAVTAALWQGCRPGHKVTFADDISPVIYTNCTPCHRPGGGGPFPLITYHDVSKRGKMVHKVTSIHYMPPWPADVSYSRFKDEKRLTDEQIALITEWYEQGCPPGDTAKLKTPDILVNKSLLGKPDVIIPVDSTFIQGNYRDKFYVIKIPFSLPKDTMVKAVEFIPGCPDLVHHMNGHLLNYLPGKKHNVFDGTRKADTESPDFDNQFKALLLGNDDGTYPEAQRVHSAVNYLPGTYGVKYPDGIGGFYIAKNGAFVANDIHYGPSTKSVWDKSFLYVYYAKTPPKRPTSELMLGTNGIAPIIPPLVLPPNTLTKHRTQLTIYNDISVLTINPHMHLLGKSLTAYALKPNGDTVKLIRIPQWSFRWQYFYTYKTMLKIPKGSTIVVEAEFDNTIKNPNNPFNPPRTVSERLERGGASMRTTDEMLQFIITYLPYQKGDENVSLE